jgi:heme A synthase
VRIVIVSFIPSTVLTQIAPLTAEGWYVEGSPVLLAVIALAGTGTGALFLVSLIAYRRRRSEQYRLISAAVAVLVVRTVVGAGTVLGIVPMPVHHFVAHSLDFLIAAMVLYAVYAHAPGSISDDVTAD